MWNRESSVKGKDIVQPVSPAPAGERGSPTRVGKSVVFKGTLTSSEDMTIDGHVEGIIEVPDQGLTLGPDADIRADIVARSVTIHGTVSGNIRAGARVDIRETGCVDGSLVAPRIAISDGAVVRGRVDTVAEKSDAPEVQAQFAIA